MFDLLTFFDLRSPAVHQSPVEPICARDQPTGELINPALTPYPESCGQTAKHTRRVGFSCTFARNVQ